MGVWISGLALGDASASLEVKDGYGYITFKLDKLESGIWESENGFKKICFLTHFKRHKWFHLRKSQANGTIG